MTGVLLPDRRAAVAALADRRSGALGGSDGVRADPAAERRGDPREGWRRLRCAARASRLLPRPRSPRRGSVADRPRRQPRSTAPVPARRRTRALVRFYDEALLARRRGGRALRALARARRDRQGRSRDRPVRARGGASRRARSRWAAATARCSRARAGADSADSSRASRSATRRCEIAAARTRVDAVGAVRRRAVPAADGAYDLGHPLARARARSRARGAARGGRARVPARRRRGAARGEPVGAPREQARHVGRGRAPAASRPRERARARRARPGCASNTSSRIALRCSVHRFWATTPAAARVGRRAKWARARVHCTAARPRSRGGSSPCTTRASACRATAGSASPASGVQRLSRLPRHARRDHTQLRRRRSARRRCPSRATRRTDSSARVAEARERLVFFFEQAHRAGRRAARVDDVDAVACHRAS